MIRTALDRGFDTGAAAWALDLTGCVATARSEAAALEALPGRAEEFAAWLERSGEPVPPQAGPPDVVERVDTRLLDGGYEVNATFEADREPVSEEETDRTLRWLELAHRRLGTAIASAGARSLSGKGRTRAELLDHIVRAECWLATRVERDQNAIAFPPDNAPIEERRAENRSFVRQHVIRLSDGDGVNERVDSKGESWTARKVLRRLVYHVLDHADELERRTGGDVS